MSTTPHDTLVPPTAPEEVTNGQLFMMLQSLHAQQSVNNATVLKLDRDFNAYKAAQEDLVRAWDTWKGFVRFLKVVGLVAAAVTAIAAAVRLGLDFVWSHKP